MPPPKAKLHKNTGRLKNINTSYVDTSTASRTNSAPTNTSNQPNTAQADRNRGSGLITAAATSSQANSPAIEQFELELYWCIQTLEHSLNSGKLNAKQGMTFDHFRP